MSSDVNVEELLEARVVEELRGVERRRVEGRPLLCEALARVPRHAQQPPGDAGDAAGVGGSP